MHAYILTGSTAEERSDYIKKLLNERSISPHDVIAIIPEPISISVESIRSAIIRVSIHPQASPYHAVVVWNAQTMTLEAQNAFLKTLEEPPGDARIILETNQPDALLPTILSRCQLIDLGSAAAYTDEEILQCINTLKFLREASIGKRLQKIDVLTKTRDDALAFTNLAIAAMHTELVNQAVTKLQSNKIAKLLRSLLATRTQLLGNINPKLALDDVFLYNNS